MISDEAFKLKTYTTCYRLLEPFYKTHNPKVGGSPDKSGSVENPSPATIYNESPVNSAGLFQ
jgi:hypothetical protein